MRYRERLKRLQAKAGGNPFYSHIEGGPYRRFDGHRCTDMTETEWRAETATVPGNRVVEIAYTVVGREDDHHGPGVITYDSAFKAL